MAPSSIGLSGSSVRCRLSSAFFIAIVSYCTAVVRQQFQPFRKAHPPLSQKPRPDVESMLTTTTRRITGASLSAEAFLVHETSGPVDVSLIGDVLRGSLAAYQVHGFVPLDTCQRIVANFWQSPGRVPRYGEGEDGVEAYLIGASHYGKPTMTYLEEARACKDHVEGLYDGIINPVAAFRNILANSMTVRAASLDGFPAGDSKA